MIRTAYKMNINQFQYLILKTKAYMQIWTPKETGQAVAICNSEIDKDTRHNGTIEIDTKGNSQLKQGTIIIITDLK